MTGVVRGFVQADLARWGLTALAIAAVGFAAGRCSDRTGPFGRQAELAIDSARVAAAAFDAGQRLDSVRAAAQAAVLRRRLDSAEARLAHAGRQTTAAGAGVAAGIREVIRLVPATDTAALAALRSLEDSLGRYDAAVAAERARAALAIEAARFLADTVGARAGRLEMALAAVQRQRNEGLEREARLARQLHGWRLAVTAGPGVSVDAGGLRVAPLQLSVGASREIRLPRLF